MCDTDIHLLWSNDVKTKRLAHACMHARTHRPVHINRGLLIVPIYLINSCGFGWPSTKVAHNGIETETMLLENKLIHTAMLLSHTRTHTKKKERKIDRTVGFDFLLALRTITEMSKLLNKETRLSYQKIKMHIECTYKCMYMYTGKYEGEVYTEKN